MSNSLQNRMKGGLKRLLLPAGPRPRKLYFGPARGGVVTIDLQHSLRLYFGLYEKEIESYFRLLISPGDNCFAVGGQYG